MSILLIVIPVVMGVSMLWLQGIATMGMFLYIALFLIAIGSSFAALFFDDNFFSAIRSVEWVIFAFALYVMWAAFDIVAYYFILS